MKWGRSSWSRDRELLARVAERALKQTGELVCRARSARTLVSFARSLARAFGEAGREAHGVDAESGELHWREAGRSVQGGAVSVLMGLVQCE